jgi:hypothetical protein
MRPMKVAKPLVLIAVVLFTEALSLSAVFTNSTKESVSVWSEIVVEAADAYSHSGAYAIRDCLRPLHIDCFSIQQNFWIWDSSGDPMLWIRNSVELANLGGVYYGTYSFQMYSRDSRNEPLLCEPESNSTSICRSPFYVDYADFPRALKFYSHISNDESNYTLQMYNNFGVVNWRIPSTVRCPCSIGTTPRLSQPWGVWPFEFVTVGLDDTATATFRNDTKGTIGSTLVQLVDGTWHETTTDTIRCAQLAKCLSMLSTQENSEGLTWDTTKGEFYWSKDAIDQGIHIIGIADESVGPPTPPTPRMESYLYIRFSSAFAYLSIYDQSQRVAGIDPRSGKTSALIPNSSVVFSSYVPVKDSPVSAPEEELLILKPEGTYQIVVTAGGNTVYSIYLVKATNINGPLFSQSYAGSLTIGDSKRLELQVNPLNLSPEALPFSGLLSVAVIMAALVGLVLLIIGVLAERRRRIRRLSHRRDLDEL